MIFDISQTLSPLLPVFPGDPRIEIEQIRVEGLSPYFLSRVNLGSHSGTHVDAPGHFERGGKGVLDLDLEVLIGPAFIVDLTGVSGAVRASHLAAAGIPEGAIRLLLKTANSLNVEAVQEFQANFVALDVDGAEWAIQHGVRLLGIDAPSIESFENTGFPVHRLLLGHETILLEGVTLAGVRAGFYELVCLPLKLATPDGSPARAILINPE